MSFFFFFSYFEWMNWVRTSFPMLSLPNQHLFLKVKEICIICVRWFCNFFCPTLKIGSIVVCVVMNKGGLCPVGGVIRVLLGCGSGKGRVMSHVRAVVDTHNELYVSIWFAGVLPSVMFLFVRTAKIAWSSPPKHNNAAEHCNNNDIAVQCNICLGCLCNDALPIWSKLRFTVFDEFRWMCDLLFLN